MKMWLLLITAGVLVYLLGSVGRMYRLAKLSGELIKRSQPYEQSPKNPTQNILILGDSTAAGVGTSNASYSVAGRIGGTLSKAKITNLSKSGMKSEELVANLPNEGGFDLIIIHIGANDAIRWRNLDQTGKNLEHILKWASEHSRQTALFTSGKIGEAPFFASYLKPILNSRALKLREIAIGLAGKFPNVKYVNLVQNGKDLFGSDPEQYYSADGLHPSDAGYELWYQELRKVINITEAS